MTLRIGLRARRRSGLDRALQVSCALALAVAFSNFSSPALADDDVTVEATVDSRDVGAGETLQFKVEVRGSGVSTVTPSPPRDLTNLDVVGGPSTSSSFSFMNGAVSSSKSFTWILVPRAAGTAHIPALDVKIGDKTYRTEAIDIKVSSAGSRPASPDRPPRGAAPGARDPGTAEVRLENELSSEKVYVGQPVVLTTRLLTRVPVQDVSQSPDPTLPGFILEESESNLTPERVFREGREYQSFVLMRRILTPTTPGKTVVPAERRAIRIRTRGTGDPFQAFFSPPMVDVERATAPVTIEVLAPPAQGRPAGFSGAAGNFRLEAVADRKEAAVGESVGLVVTVSGTGNLKTVATPTFSPSADFRIFDPRIEEKANGVRPRTYTKIWNYVLTPLAPGSITLPTITFTYFDPESGSYRTLSAPPAPLMVNRGEPGALAGQAPSAAGRKEVQALQRDIRFLKALDRPLQRRTAPLHSRWWLWSLLGLAAGVQPIAWYAGRKGGVSALLPGWGRGRARRRALQEIARARRIGDDAALASSAAAKAIVGFVADRCGLQASGLTYDSLDEILSSRGVKDELRAESRALLEQCDLGRFAPADQRGTAGGDLLGRAAGLVEKLERVI